MRDNDDFKDKFEEEVRRLEEEILNIISSENINLTDDPIENHSILPKMFNLFVRLIDLVENLQQENRELKRSIVEVYEYILEAEQGIKHDDTEKMNDYCESAYLNLLEKE